MRVPTNCIANEVAFNSAFIEPDLEPDVIRANIKSVRGPEFVAVARAVHGSTQCGAVAIAVLQPDDVPE